MKKNVALLLFDEVEVLDFAGPFEVFAVTDELRRYETFNVFTVAQEQRPIRARHGLSVNPDHDFASCPAPHLLIVPGGFGTRALLKNEAVLAWLRTAAASAEIVMSVCTGSVVLGRAGLLDGLRATTHHECFALLREHAPRTEVVETARFVDNGKILTAAGISAGIDCSLHLVARVLGPAAATTTARYMEYHGMAEGLKN
ncbi:MAG: DJ-1/PfpI family protein [Opitutus sp.]|nr:DJ-1/PfpI family protein [Opitutus sp.]